MPGTGVNRYTGQPLSGWDHLRQSLEVLFTTRIGSRVLKRTFGSEIPQLLGDNIVPSTFLKFATAIHVALELWEPRFRLTQVTFPRDPSAEGTTAGTNSQQAIRSGRIGIALFGQYRPRGHLGDPTPEGGSQTLFL